MPIRTLEQIIIKTKQHQAQNTECNEVRCVKVIHRHGYVDVSKAISLMIHEHVTALINTSVKETCDGTTDIGTSERSTQDV